MDHDLGISLPDYRGCQVDHDVVISEVSSEYTTIPMAAVVVVSMPTIMDTNGSGNTKKSLVTMDVLIIAMAAPMPHRMGR